MASYIGVTMKFLITLNMPSAQGYPVHQVICDHGVKSLEEFCISLQDNDFLISKQLYRQKTPEGEVVWEDRGRLIINTHHIGKVQEWRDRAGPENA